VALSGLLGSGTRIFRDSTSEVGTMFDYSVKARKVPNPEITSNIVRAASRSCVPTDTGSCGIAIKTASYTSVPTDSPNKLCETGTSTDMTEKPTKYEWYCRVDGNSNLCTASRTHCELDGVIMQVGESRKFYTRRVSKVCEGEGSSNVLTCDSSGNITGDSSTYKYRTCATIKASEF
jgi:hypothetical protein